MAKSKKNKKEEVLEELAVILKSSNKNKQKDVELEEEDSHNLEKLEKGFDLTNLDLKDMEFHSQPQIDEGSSAPVLERIVGEQPRPIFVGGMPRGTEISSNDNGGGGSKDDFKYVPGAENRDDPKYIPTSEFQDVAIERINTETIGRRQDLFPRANEGRFAGESTSRFESQSIEKYERVERFEMEKAGRQSPFERQTEDRRYKPKLPKS